VSINSLGNEKSDLLNNGYFVIFYYESCNSEFESRYSGKLEFSRFTELAITKFKTLIKQLGDNL